METVLVKGSHFFSGRSGTQFFVRGINYQDDGDAASSAVSYSDPLENSTICERDAKYLEELGINTIAVQWLDPGKNHSSCMKILEEKGIYVLAGLGAPNENIQQRQIWDRELQDRFRNVADGLRAHPNLLGFFITGSTITLPFIRAAVRDLKQHLIQNEPRQIPIGYLSMYNHKLDLFQALNCGKQTTSIDFLVLQESECNAVPELDKTMNNITKEYAEYPIPIIFSAEDCNPQQGSNIEAARLMNNQNVTDVLSGTVLFSYFNSSTYNINGIVNVSGGKVRKGPEYINMSNEMKSIKPSPTQMSTYTPSKLAPAACTSPLTLSFTILADKFTKTTRLIVATDLPPSPNPRLCECMVDSLDCVANPITVGTAEIEPNSMETVIALPEENKIVQNVCKQNSSNCLETRVDIVSGQYGNISSCNATERGSWMLNQYYLGRNADPASCSSLGGYIRTNRSSQAQTGDCGLILHQAGLPDKGNYRHQDAGHRSLTTPDKIGIGLGVSFLILLIASCFFFWLWRRRRARAKANAEDEFRKAELPDTSIQLPREGPYEVNGSDEIVELEANPTTRNSQGHEMVELPTPLQDGSPWTESTTDGELVELPTPKLDSSPGDRSDSDDGIIELPTPRDELVSPRDEHMSPHVGTQSGPPSPIQYR